MGAVAELAELCVKGKPERSSTKTVRACARTEPETVRNRHATHGCRTCTCNMYTMEEEIYRTELKEFDCSLKDGRNLTNLSQNTVYTCSRPYMFINL